jgi:pyruvate/2-oxoglutarate/acetoin dehydrogenase E1 component
MEYKQQLCRAMELLARNPKTIFLGQAVNRPGTGISPTLEGVPAERRVELPVAEEMQLGMSVGMALSGLIPVSIFTRWNFLILAANQLVNHLDKLEAMSGGGYRPRVIIRTAIGSERPLHPREQHIGDFTGPFAEMCPQIHFVRLTEPSEIVGAYQYALEREDGRSTVLVEFADYYNEK